MSSPKKDNIFNTECGINQKNGTGDKIHLQMLQKSEKVDKTSRKPSRQYDAQRDHSVAKARHSVGAMKTTGVYTRKITGDPLEIRGSVSKLQLNYSRTNTALNERLMISDTIKQYHNQVLPRKALVNSLERRLDTLTKYRRQPVVDVTSVSQPVNDVTSVSTQQPMKTVAAKKADRAERIQKQQKVPRTVDTMKVWSAEDIDELRSLRYLRVSQE